MFYSSVMSIATFPTYVSSHIKPDFSKMSIDMDFFSFLGNVVNSSRHFES